MYLTRHSQRTFNQRKPNSNLKMCVPDRERVDIWQVYLIIFRMILCTLKIGSPLLFAWPSSIYFSLSFYYKYHLFSFFHFLIDFFSSHFSFLACYKSFVPILPDPWLFCVPFWHNYLFSIHSNALRASSMSDLTFCFPASPRLLLIEGHHFSRNGKLATSTRLQPIQPLAHIHMTVWWIVKGQLIICLAN